MSQTVAASIGLSKRACRACLRYSLAIKLP